MSPARRRSKERTGTEKAQKSSKAKPKKSKTRRTGPKSRPDPSDTPDTEVRFVHPYQATKGYLCPGCLREIPNGVGHVVAVPPLDPDLRRHWHRACWDGRVSRR